MAPHEGSLQAPTRHPLDWQGDKFYNKDDLFNELERVYEICHGCRRCVSLCNAFPSLFDLVDESTTLEVDGVAKQDYWKVVDHCYLCDLCYMTKCPYVPPHEWNVDFPHLMLRAKAVRFKEQGASLRDKLLSSTDTVGSFAGIPIVAQTVNALNKNASARRLLQASLGVAAEASLPRYESRTFRKRFKPDTSVKSVAGTRTTGKVAIFATCYGNRNEPGINEDLVAVLKHNDIDVTLVDKEQCCGMPKLELGDLQAVAAAKQANIPMLVKCVDAGYDLIAPIPSCALMFRQELPLMFPDDEQVKKVQQAFFDPFEYLFLRHKDGLLRTSFRNQLGKLVYHAACHQRVQNIGMKTRDVLQLIEGTRIETIERCSGHDGTYAVKAEFHQTAKKICRPVVSKVQAANANYYTSDCIMAGHMIASGMEDGSDARHPISLLRLAYGI